MSPSYAYALYSTDIALGCPNPTHASLSQPHTSHGTFRNRTFEKKNIELDEAINKLIWMLVQGGSGNLPVRMPLSL